MNADVSGFVSSGRVRVVLGLAVIVLAVVVYLLDPVVPDGDRTPEARVIDVVAEAGGFDRSSIRVRAGERVTIRFRNPEGPFPMPGAGRHQFAVEELGVSIVAPAGGWGSVTFTPQRPGTYVFYCDVCCGGRATPGMSGELIVQAS